MNINVVLTVSDLMDLIKRKFVMAHNILMRNTALMKGNKVLLMSRILEHFITTHRDLCPQGTDFSKL